MEKWKKTKKYFWKRANVRKLGVERRSVSHRALNIGDNYPKCSKLS